MTRNAGLAHAQNLLQFRDGELLLFEQEKQTKPRRVREDAQQIYG
jgi:hypothetical protein